MFPSRPLVATLLFLPLVACGWATDPVSLEVQFIGRHTSNADGTCTVQFAALATGIGSLAWERVAVLRGTTLVEELLGAQTAEFWGASRLAAGQQQLSEPFAAPARGADTRIEITYRATGSEAREATLRPVCP